MEILWFTGSALQVRGDVKKWPVLTIPTVDFFIILITNLLTLAILILDCICGICFRDFVATFHPHSLSVPEIYESRLNLSILCGKSNIDTVSTIVLRHNDPLSVAVNLGLPDI